MKTIERKDWSDWRYTFTCTRCQSKLEADVNDIIHTPASGGNPHDHCPETFTVRCNVCNLTQYVSHEAALAMPDMVKHLARERCAAANVRAYYDR